jgi:hypothetical protein
MKEEEGMWYYGVHRDSEPRWTMIEGGGPVALHDDFFLCAAGSTRFG